MYFHMSEMLSPHMTFLCSVKHNLSKLIVTVYGKSLDGKSLQGETLSILTEKKH